MAGTTPTDAEQYMLELINMARTNPAEVDVRLTCPPEILRALRPEQVVPQVEVLSKEPTGVLAHVPVEVSVDKCNALITPDKVIVKW